MKLCDLIATLKAHDGAATLPENVGDGYLYWHNPIFARIRDAVREQGYALTTEGPPGYFGFPLVSLEAIFETRQIPYRDNLRGLESLEASRPEFFELRDLRLNRPMPNYVLHESAHAVAFSALIDDEDVREALRDPRNLVPLIIGEAFAMTVEYLAACCVSGKVHEWVFSINSYRHRVPGRKAILELSEAFGPEAIAWAILASFTYNNFFVDKLSERRLDAILSAYNMAAPLHGDRAAKKRLRAALGSLMQMDSGFRYDTSRLFLCSLGYGRDVRAVLGFDPLEAIVRESTLQAAVLRLVAIVCRDAEIDQPVRCAAGA